MPRACQLMCGVQIELIHIEGLPPLESHACPPCDFLVEVFWCGGTCEQT